MKFTIGKGELLRGVGRIQSIVEKRNTMPILANVLIETTENGIQLTTTDLEVGIQCEVEARIEGRGATTLPAKRLANIVRELESDVVEFETDERNTTTIRCPGSFFPRETPCTAMISKRASRMWSSVISVPLRWPAMEKNTSTVKEIVGSSEHSNLCLRPMLPPRPHQR